MEAKKVTSSHKPPSDGSVAKEEFILVGTTLYKIVEQPGLSGGYVKKRIPWNNETLRQDYGKDYIGSVPKYDGFCTVPEHIGYRPVIGKFLNLYEPIDHQPQEGDFPSIRSLVEHIFGEQYELGMDYLQLLYLQPVQKLPILLLVSEERNTGKSTFLNFLKALFQNNVTFNTNEDFRSQFNSDWAGKLLIVVDEVLLNRREDSERLKNLSTTLSYKVEANGKDRDEIAFFAKFVLCSNNEHLPVIIDAGETRYWVRKIVPLQSDDTDFLQKLKAEIPAFLHFLQHRQLSTEKESRMWFNPKLQETDALRKIIRSHRIRTAGIRRKITPNQVRAIRIVLSGTHEDMIRVQNEGRLNEWCDDNLQWLHRTFGKENTVSAVLHMDEHTPHIHATVVPIVTGERRKARKKQAEGKRTYRKKANTVRLCADDLMSRERLVAYHDSYAKAMAKYGLQRGIRGSEARHTTTAQYYRDLKRQTGEFEANVQQLQTEQRQAERQLDEVLFLNPTPDIRRGRPKEQNRQLALSYPL